MIPKINPRQMEKMMRQMGVKESFQISGEIEESTISEEDIKTVAEQSNVSLKEAEEALEKTNGDLAEAILILKE